MTLAEIIRQRQFIKPAGATAIPAADTGGMRISCSVVKVATVAVATSFNDVQTTAPVEEGCNDIAVEPASRTARPIYWESMDGHWHGPAYPEYLGRTGRGTNEQFWVIVNHNGSIQWIWADLLRSYQAFLAGKRKRT